MQPSGLPDVVGDAERLVRFLTSSSHFNATLVKPSAVLPGADGETSVFRATALPDQELRTLGAQHLPGVQRIYGVAAFAASSARTAGLEVVPSEPPPRHANLIRWPTDADPELAKARRKETALLLCRDSVLQVWDRGLSRP